MSLDFLFHIVENVKKLNWEAVLRSKIRLHALATALESRSVVDFSEFDNVDDLRAALRATSALPVIEVVPSGFGVVPAQMPG